MKYIIVAYDKNRLIGGNNTLLWMGEMAADMRRFRELTTDNVVVMGRKTYDSIGKPLPNRQNIVVSRQSIQIDGVTVVHSIEEAYSAAEPGKDVYVIGGGQIFEQSLGSVDEVLATEIDAAYEGDVFFQKLPSVWQEKSRESHLADEKNKYNYSFVAYTKQQSAL
ncbi:MAG: dihydrofolate reductase [Candidatus Saccharimonadales bacterium]